MCNRPKCIVSEMGGLCEELVPTVEMAVNALAAAAQEAASRHQLRSDVWLSGAKNRDGERALRNSPLDLSGRESWLKDFSQSPVSTAMPTSFIDCGLELSRKYAEKHDDDNGDEEYRPDYEENEAYRQSLRRSSRRSSRKKPTPDDPGWTAKHFRRRFVHHNYHDHAADEEAPLTASGQVDCMTAKGGVITPFPLVLHNMLDSVEDQDLSHIVSWQPHGRAFCVHDPKAFVTRVMPIFFRQTKMSSFQRQLNLYGFARLTSPGPDKGGYYNEYFLRGRSDLTVHMHRTRVKGTGVRTSSNPMEEPNFYEFPPVETANKPESMKIDVPRPESVSSTLYPILELRHSNDMIPIPNKEPSMSLSPRFVNMNNATTCGSSAETLDLEDVNVKEMASFLNEVDLSCDDVSGGDPSMLTIFGRRVDVDQMSSTAV